MLLRSNSEAVTGRESDEISKFPTAVTSLLGTLDRPSEFPCALLVDHLCVLYPTRAEISKHHPQQGQQPTKMICHRYLSKSPVDE